MLYLVLKKLFEVMIEIKSFFDVCSMIERVMKDIFVN